MEFPYVLCEGAHRRTFHRPYLPIVLRNRDKRFRVPHALVDTGSDVTLLPLDIAHYLEIELDDTEGITLAGASGGSFTALPSRKPISYTIEAKGYRPISWQGVVYFAEREPVVLLGHHQCLEQFDLTFQGREKLLSVMPRFRV